MVPTPGGGRCHGQGSGGGSTGQRGADSRRLGQGGVGKPWNCQGRVSQEGGPGRILGDPNTTGQKEEGKEKE